MSFQLYDFSIANLYDTTKQSEDYFEHLLDDSGKVTAEMAKAFAESEFENTG